ncbi:hypothetical protein [Aromatoleum aromaticum]|nr:hypothetical protein [Aromatoleum aromaticum]
MVDENMALLLNQAGLVLGFLGSIVLALSGTVGVIGKNGSIIFTGLDPMEPSDRNIERVKRSHRRNRIYTPLGWGMLAAAFLLQFAATF